MEKKFENELEFEEELKAEEELESEEEPESEDEEEELDRICGNCTFFFVDEEDFDTDFGVCMQDSAFDPFGERIVEDGNFSSCFSLYRQKRFDGDREPCDQFEFPETLDIPEGMSLSAYFEIENLKNGNVDELIKYLDDDELADRAIARIETCIRMGNENAYQSLIDYYTSMGPAGDLADVHNRVKIVEALSARELDKRTVDAYINELLRSPSNNTTGQLYRAILRELGRCPEEMVQEPLWELLGKKKFGAKMQERILEAAEGKARFDHW